MGQVPLAPFAGVLFLTVQQSVLNVGKIFSGINDIGAKGSCGPQCLELLLCFHFLNNSRHSNAFDTLPQDWRTWIAGEFPLRNSR